MRGQDDALQELGLDNVSYPRPKPHHTSTSTLQIAYNEVLHTAVAARELSLGLLEKQCQQTLEFIQAVAVSKKITLQHNIDGRDVAELILSLTDEELQRHYIRDDSQEESEKEEQEEGETDPDKTKEDSDKEISAVRKKTIIQVVEGDEEQTKESQAESEREDIPPREKQGTEQWGDIPP